MASNEKVRLTLTKSESDTSNNTQYRLDMSIEATDGLINNSLFVVRRASPIESTTPGDAPRDEFWGICRYVDVSTLGVGAPNKGRNFYLTNEWTLVFGNAQTREEAIVVLKGDVKKLAKEIGSFVSPNNAEVTVFEQDY
jgi:hypothetical protein